jgi:Flp pilus assembly pilin Flp
MRTHEHSGRGARRLQGDAGAGLVEYALLTALIAVVCITALRYFQVETTESLSRSSSAIVNAGR